MGAVTLELLSGDQVFLTLAREIAMELHGIETILKNHQISTQEWEGIRTSPRFLKLLESEVIAWNSATNTHERTKLKAAAMFEFWLEEANARAHDNNETLSSKTELMKLVARVAGMGLTGSSMEGGGSEKFSVVINLGADHKLTFQKELPMKVIEGEAVKE